MRRDTPNPNPAPGRGPRPQNGPLDPDHWPVRISAALLGELVACARRSPDKPMIHRMAIQLGERVLLAALNSMRAELNRRIARERHQVRAAMCYVVSRTPPEQLDTVIAQWFPGVSWPQIELEIEIFRRSIGLGPLGLGPLEEETATTESTENTEEK